MFETIVNAFKTKDIRIKMWLTLAMLLVYRIGCYIPIPGLNSGALEQMLGGTDFLGILSMITGGSLANATLFSLGILPFINAFIIMQLLTLVIPAFERMSKEGEEGRNKLTQITRYFAIGLAVIQGIGIVVGWKTAITGVFAFEAGWEYPYFTMAGVIIILVAGSMMCMWLSERITEYGIGNGTSLIIFVGILSTAGTTMASAFKMVGEEWTYIWNILGFILIVVGIFFFIVFIDLSERRITVQYSKQIKGNKMRSPVAENAPPNPRGPLTKGLPVPPEIALKMNVGMSAMSARKIAPNNVIRFEIFLKKSLVGLPALIPGINPPYCWMFFDTSSGLNCICA